ncbi:5849_t:CDS:2 [Dentiscutata erythropus]|uniref:5849_t:CDS:1 n=1 Tax=Dentiscutata erythropus TaxID=1348616 RepID=A0A9N9ACQ0_9GLOM|nr:5849_t:CDS:2 [Dentiscutata erythropus]
MDDYKQFLCQQLIQLIRRPNKNKRKIVRRVIEKVCNRAEYKFKVSCKDCEKIAEIIRNIPPEEAIGSIVSMTSTLQIDLVIPGPLTLRRQRLPRLKKRSKQRLPRPPKKSQALISDSMEKMALLNAPLEKIINWPFYPLENCFSSAYYLES